MIQHFTRTEISDDATETLSLVRTDNGDLYVQITAGEPEADGTLSGDYVGLYDLGGDQVNGTVGPWSLVSGDRLPAGDEARKVAEALTEEANRHGARVTVADYLAEDGSLPLAAIFEDWASGGRIVEAWKPAA
jgi:hypothetical protein